MTGPLEALADATVEIGKGHYSHRVTAEATAEMAELVRSFNHMAADLEQSRLLAETSARELSAANLAIEARRKELETILETIPSGVVTLDASRRIVLGNRAFAELVRLEGQPDLAGVSLDSLLPAEFNEELIRLERRARRMGVASSEFELRTPRGVVNLSVTLAALDPPQRAESRFDPRARRHVGIPARAAPGRVERGRAAGGARNQKPAHAHHALCRAHSPPRRSRPAGIARRHSQMLRRDPRLGGVDAHAGRASSPRWRSFPSRIRTPRI